MTYMHNAYVNKHTVANTVTHLGTLLGTLPDVVQSMIRLAVTDEFALVLDDEISRWRYALWVAERVSVAEDATGIHGPITEWRARWCISDDARDTQATRTLEYDWPGCAAAKGLHFISMAAPSFGDRVTFFKGK